MAFTMQGQVGSQNAGSGSPATYRVDNTGATVTHEMNGKHAEQTLRGNSFLYTIASQALVIAGTGGGSPTVINPVGSGVIWMPTYLTISFISGTTVIGAVVLADTLNVGGGAATGAAIKTATLVAAVNALRGSGGVARCQWSPTTNTFTAAQTVNYATSINLGAAAPTGSGTYTHQFNGTYALYPGTATSVCYTVTTSTALFAISIAAVEIPLPSGL
jgi:hypothetical protein